MELGKEFLKAIKNRSGQNAAFPEMHSQTIKTEALQLDVTVTDADRLSCQLESLYLRKTEQEGPDLTRVKSQASQLERTITYLLEDIALIELDPFDYQAQLKSEVPRSEGDSISYYELLLDKGDALSLVRTRYDKESGTKTRVPMTFTSEVAERLLGDLGKILS